MANNQSEFVIYGRNLHVEGTWQVDFETFTRTGNRWHPFKGELVKRCMPALRQLTRNKSKGTSTGLKASLASMIDFIDMLDAVSFPSEFVTHGDQTPFEWSLIEKIWPSYIAYLRLKNTTDAAKYLITTGLCRIFRTAHRLASGKLEHSTELRIEPHFFSGKSNSYSGDEVSLEDASALFRGLGRLFLASTARIDKCQNLLSTGTDPRQGRGGWAEFSNRLWVTANLFPNSNEQSKEEISNIRNRMNAYSIPDEYHIPSLDDDKLFYRQKYNSCLEFTRTEISLALALVAQKTGFNPDALARMTTDDWVRASLIGSDSHVVIQAKKRGGSYYLTATSSKVKRLDPYRVIQEVIKKQRKIREQLAEEARQNNDTHLAARAKLIWIFRDAHGQIKDLSSETVGGGGLSREARIISDIIKHLNLQNAEGSLLQFDFSTARDTWALFTYRKSNGNLFLTAKALGHRSISSLLHYLEKRQLIIEDKKRLIDLQNRIFSDILDDSFDPLQLRGRLQKLPISSKGLRCIDPLHPTAEG